jgi:hypothetical protein
MTKRPIGNVKDREKGVIMKTKISLIALSLGVCAWAVAAEYKSPNVEFKGTTPSHTETKVAEFNDEYKVEGAVKTDRGIASEKEEQREPSSVVAAEKKKVDEPAPEDKEDKVQPKPWLYKNKLDTAY